MRVQPRTDEKKSREVSRAWCVYILESEPDDDGKVETYGGCTNKRPEKRQAVHNRPSNTCKSTRDRQWRLVAYVTGFGEGRKKTADGAKSAIYARTLRFEWHLRKRKRMVASRRRPGTKRSKWVLLPRTRPIHLRLGDARALLAKPEWRDLTLHLVDN
jgi:hypothetical protein